MPCISRRSLRQSDYNSIPPSCPIVIDNGGSTFRIGWAGESDPRLTFTNVVQRPRHKVTGETVTIVGDPDPALMKYFDCSRSSYRSAFDSNVVYQFEIMEHVMDFGFDRMGIEGSLVDHPILITECVCNPAQSRSKMAELLFETYGVPSVAFGVDAAFSYIYNQRLGICDKDGLAICSGFTTSHVIPFVNGEPVFDASCRANIGGYHVTDYLKQLLSLKYPSHVSSLSWDKVEGVKMQHSYVAQNYSSELKLFQNGGSEAEERMRCWKLPWVPLPVEVPPSEEETVRKAAIKEKKVQRMRDMAAARNSSRITNLENEQRGLQILLNECKTVKPNDMQAFLSGSGYVSKEEIESDVVKLSQSLIRANGEGRKQAKQKPLKEELDQEQKRQENVDKSLELEQLHAKHKELYEMVKQRKRLKTSGSHVNRNQIFSSSFGRGERLNASDREKRHLLNTTACDAVKGEDTFGEKEEDWEIYKKIGKNNDDDDEGLDVAEDELAQITFQLQKMDPTFVPKMDMSIRTDSFICPLRKEDFQITLGFERTRCPEILFQPGMVGVDQAGFDEMAGISLQRLQLNDNGLGERITNSILLTGGSSLFPGMAERLEAGIRAVCPLESPIRVVRASDSVLDAWRGASSFAASGKFPVQTFSREDYYEKGEDLLRMYRLSYNI